MIPQVKRQVWTTSRKWMGNLIPFLLCVPFVVGAVLLFQPEKGLKGLILVCAIAFPIVGWNAVNLFGLWGNNTMRKLVSRLYERTEPNHDLIKVFIGAARPTYKGLLDPHEDVGFLIFHEDRLEFFGEILKLSIPKSSIDEIRFRMNPHALIGLGRWISIEGHTDDVPIRFLIEPRERPTLLGNRIFSKKLKDSLQKWAKESGPELETSPDPQPER